MSGDFSVNECTELYLSYTVARETCLSHLHIVRTHPAIPFHSTCERATVNNYLRQVCVALLFFYPILLAVCKDVLRNSWHSDTAMSGSNQVLKPTDCSLCHLFYFPEVFCFSSFVIFIRRRSCVHSESA